MATIRKVYRATLFVAIVFAMIPLHSAAKPYSIKIKEYDTWSQDARIAYNRWSSQAEVVWSQIVNVNFIQLSEADTLHIELEYNANYVFFTSYRSSNEPYHYIHYTSSDKMSDVYVSLLNNYYEATIYAAQAIYKIFKISEEEGIVSKYEFTGIPEEPIISEHWSKSIVLNEMNRETRTEVPSTTPVIRVLILFTNSSLSLMDGEGSPYKQMLLKAYKAVNEANESFYNSQVNAHLELAYLGNTSYNESNTSWINTMLRFSTNGDGYLDEVHTLRNKYKADVCVLFLNEPSACGLSQTIKAVDYTAFCMVYPYSECLEKFTTIHEIGHLVGCRHNLYADTTLTPYKYGHGLSPYRPDNGLTHWRTMMAYENQWCPSNTACRRILYWSNPNITYNGMETGTTTYENNARVWNERASTVSAFRTKDYNIALTSSSNNASSLYENYEASHNISTNNGYEVQAGQTVDMAAANEIRLLPNTHIKSGSTFRASIRSNADDNTYPQFVNSRHLSNTIAQNESRISVFPNPVTNVLTVRSTEVLQLVRIYDLNGQCLLQTAETQINVSMLPAGLYLLMAQTSSDESLQTKFIKQ